MRLILKDRCWVVHLPFPRMVKFKLLEQLPVYHLANPIVRRCELGEFAHYVIDVFVFIMT